MEVDWVRRRAAAPSANVCLAGALQLAQNGIGRARRRRVVGAR
jgi:hypothetical protein